MRKITFLIGCLDKGGSISKENLELLESLAESTHGDVQVVVAVENHRFAGREKAIHLSDIRSERVRVIKEINKHDPDYIFCFGRTAGSSAFNKGSLVLDQYRRSSHGVPDYRGQIFVVDSLSRVLYQPGIAKWLRLDILAALEGYNSTEWGDYTILQPDTPEWEECPSEYEDLAGGSIIGFDLETYPGLDPWAQDSRIRMAMFSTKAGSAVVVQAKPDSSLPEWAVKLLANPSIIKAGSNIAFDYKWCKRFGYDVESMWDTATAEHVIDCTDPNKGLKDLTFKYLPRLGHYSRGNNELVKARGGWEYVSDEEMYQYAGADAEASVAAGDSQWFKVISTGKSRAWKLCMDIYPILAAMQERGMAIDSGTNATIACEMDKHLTALRRVICEELGPINPASHQQLALALKKRIKGVDLRVAQWRKVLSDDEEEDTSTARKVLEREAKKHPVIEHVLEFRRWSKLYNSFVKGMRDKHMVKHGGVTYIHPSYLLSRTETYRLASSSPNAQQIPRKPGEDDPDTLNVKRQFISRFPGGSLLNADYAQMEVRVAAQLSNDVELIKAVKSEDIHVTTASLMMRKKAKDITDDERQAAKTVGFATLYGAGSNTISAHLGISKDVASGLMKQYFRAYPQLRAYIDRVHGNVMRTLDVTTPFGFTRTFPRPPDGNWNQYDGFRVKRQAFNTIIQSTAACIMYVALVDIEREMRRLDLKSVLVSTVHDSLMVDVYPGEEEVVREVVYNCMKHPKLDKEIKFDVPFGVDIEIGENWGEMKAVEISA